MKNTFIGAMLLALISSPALAGMWGMDWEATGEYNVDTDVSSLTAQVGRSFNLGGLTISADADFDIIGTAFSGTDYKASMDLPGMSGASVYLKTGLTSDWGGEDMIAGVTITW